MSIDEKIKIFLVDDDVVFLKSLEIEFLLHTDISIQTYTTGKFCIESLALNPDVIILDYQLDGIDLIAMNGIETLSEIKKINPLIPVVILSAQDKIEVAVKCMHMGAFDYVAKSETTFLHLQKIIASISESKKMEETERWADKLFLANKELAFQYKEKEKRASELLIANKELLYQNEEKEKRSAELIIAKEHAEESDKLKTAFLENISHEIRTPLNGIIGFSMLLNDDDVSKNDIRKYTSIINQSGKRLIDIVENILDISKIQTGQLKGSQNMVIINSIFSELLTSFTPVTDIKKLDLNFNNLNKADTIIYSDETKLYQILTNLINNAIKFTTSGSIDIGYEIRNNTVQFFVSDTGIGIPEELFDLIFDRFTQVDLTHKRGYDGAGLGLAICKGLVQLLGGRIWVESKINKGSTFYFTLPFSLADQISEPCSTHSNILEG